LVSNSGNSVTLRIEQNDYSTANNTVEIVSQNSGVGQAIHIDHSGAGEVLYVNKAHIGTDHCVQIINAGTGKDINGTADTWSVDKDGNAVFATVTSSETKIVTSSTFNAFTGTITLPDGTWLVEVFGRYHQSTWDNVDLTIDGTIVDSSGDFGATTGTGYVIVQGFKSISGAGTYSFDMTNSSAFAETPPSPPSGHPYMYAKAFRV
jgi:hypothetical protein